jgi:transposase
MMGGQATKRELFVMISLDEYVPEDHLLRAVDRYLDLSEFRLCLADNPAGMATCKGVQKMN